MATVNKIDSNITSLAFAEEATIGVLPGSPVWNPLEPNSYSDFGGEITNVSRNPINQSRQRKKGVITDLDASGAFNNDLTQTNLQDLFQGFFFADFRLKGEEIVTAVDIDAGNPDEYQVASTTGFQVNSLIKGSNFTNSTNNGFNLVTVIVSDVSVEVGDGLLVDEASPPAAAQITAVGFQGTAGDIDVDVTGNFPALTSTSLDFTTLGLIPGEAIFIGGDSASLAFSNSENNGLKRVKSIATNLLTLDKSVSVMVTEASTTETVQLFFGRVLKNESTLALQKRRTYQLERQLGAPDDALPSEIQSEYLVGSVPSEVTMNITNADKITVDINFVSTDSEQRTGVVGIKSGTRPSLVETDAFNTSSDFTRIKLATVIDGNEAPAALFAFITELTLTINNNVSPNKAVSVLGAFDITAGIFDVSGDITAYFAEVAAVTSVRNNADITLDFFVAKSNAGISVDLPLITLGDGRPDVEQDSPITLPLSMGAASGAKINSSMDHTLMMSFFDYLPLAAE